MLALKRTAGETSRARSTRLHERPYDVIPDADLRDVGADLGNHPCYFVTEHRRDRENIVSGHEQVGVTQPGRLHVDENLAPNRRGDIYNLEVEPFTECVKYERLHVCLLRSPLNWPAVPPCPGEELCANALPS
jgi:hypothetical protein